MCGVGEIVVAPLGQDPNRTTRHIAQVMQCAALQPGDGVEQHAFAQRCLAEDEAS